MLPEIFIAGSSYSTYNLALLAAMAIGWFAFLLTENDLKNQADLLQRLRTLAISTFSYVILMLVCLQGATYFHFLFDIIPEGRRVNMTWPSMLLTNPVTSAKVLYGAIFFYPIGVLLISANHLQDKFSPYLNGKIFILFLTMGVNRVGCFLNGCCFGIRSEFLGIRFPSNSAAAYEHWTRGLTPGSFHPPASLPVVPTQMIEAMFLFILSFFSWKAARNGRQDVFLRFVLFYAIFRFFLEFIRDDHDRAYWMFLSASQWLSLFIIGFYSAYRFLGKKIQNHG
jgi:phosphatidylglycerol---prolipoprotein diacylglyceryl transferase